MCQGYIWSVHSRERRSNDRLVRILVETKGKLRTLAWRQRRVRSVFFPSHLAGILLISGAAMISISARQASKLAFSFVYTHFNPFRWGMCMFSLRIFGKDLPVCCQRLSFYGKYNKHSDRSWTGEIKKTHLFLEFLLFLSISNYLQLSTARSAKSGKPLTEMDTLLVFQWFTKMAQQYSQNSPQNWGLG